jgi:cation diffusion facilitator family transporter
MSDALPPKIAADLRQARRLEWWTLGWMSSIVGAMALVMGASQAMRSALIEDMLSLVPAIVYLVATRFEGKSPTRSFPFGYHRVHSLGFLISAVTLTAVGGLLLFEAATTLIHQEHVTIPPVRLFGQDIWLGWLMIAVLVYSVIPPVLLGHRKLPLAERLQDKVLHTDAMMQKADWMTGIAGIAGIIGLGLGFWWADAAAAAIISGSILKDGIGALRSSTAELVDGAPRALGRDAIADDARALREALERRYPGAEVRLRETGRFIQAQVSGVEAPPKVRLADMWPGDPGQAWRLAQLSFVPIEPDEDV